MEILIASVAVAVLAFLGIRIDQTKKSCDDKKVEQVKKEEKK